jgi:drug/metabolite transporter (DMT)-like permease
VSEGAPARPPARLALVLLAFAAIYLIWGSTYLAIRFAIETLPPFLMAGVRFLIAGALMIGITRLRGVPWPNRRQWRAALVIGGLLLMGGNGAVVFGQQWVPSGSAALLVATTPFWMVLLEWSRRGGTPPTGPVVGGLVLGFVGIAVLIGPGEWAGGGVAPWGAAAVLFGCLSWAAGSIFTRGAPLPESPLMATSMQMLAGGALLTLLGLVTGEAAQVSLAGASFRSLAAFAYLVLIGSLVGFTAFTWLLRVSTPAKVSTYAYVNPVVAVLLGWALAGEALTPRVGVAVVVILVAVAAIASARRPRRGWVRARARMRKWIRRRLAA